MIRFRRVGIVAAVLFLAATTACDDAAGPDGDTVTIAMRDNQFDPTSRTVARGTTVRWVNQGSTAHNTLAATNACCEPLKVPPDVEVVNTGKTSVSVDITISAASPAPAPSTRKVCSR